MLLDGTVRCWGRNDRAQLYPVPPPNHEPSEVINVTDAVDLAVGGHHSCVVRRGGTVSCWGDNMWGQLDGSRTKTALPLDVPGLSDATTVVAGAKHTCALRRTGKVTCWGFGLGRQAPESPSWKVIITPVEVRGVSDVVELCSGETHVCARTSVGRVFCWGNQVQSWPGEPRRISGLGFVTSLVASGGDMACSQNRVGAVHCWGGIPEHTEYDIGHLELDTRHWVKAFGVVYTKRPQRPQGLPEASTKFVLSKRSRCGCALQPRESPLCWFPGISEEDYEGPDNITGYPRKLSNLSDVVDVGVGARLFCVLRRGGVTQCAPLERDMRELSIEAQARDSHYPVPEDRLVKVGAYPDIVELSVGSSHACLRLQSGRVLCWGNSAHHIVGDGFGIHHSASVNVDLTEWLTETAIRE